MAYTTIDDPSAHFQTALYTGSGSSQSITNDGTSDLQPDFIWFKNRSEIVQHSWWDTTRGITKFLVSNNTAGDQTNLSGYELTSFNTDGFSLGLHNNAGINQSSAYNYVAWQWKANGGTTSSNTNGGITTTVQANTAAGFSIVTYTGDGATSQTVGHGLGAVPAMIISKDRDGTSNVPNWRVYHQGTGNTKYLSFDNNGAATFDDWGNTTPTSSVYTIGGSGGYRPTNTSGIDYIAYVFAEKQGYSKFGTYTGNGNTNGPFVYTGFKPAFIIRKSFSTGGWAILDYKRSPTNLADQGLSVGDNSAESNYLTIPAMDILSNGFKLRTTRYEANQNGTQYIYMAFAENPFVTSTGIPTTAR